MKMGESRRAVTLFFAFPHRSHYSPQRAGTLDSLDDLKNKRYFEVYEGEESQDFYSTGATQIHGNWVSVDLDDRRCTGMPVWTLQGFASRRSYFSEEAALLQRLNAHLQRKLYSPHLGRYKHSFGEYLNVKYQPPSFLTVSSLSLSLDGKTLALGYGNGYIKIQDVGSSVRYSIKLNDNPKGRITRIRFFKDKMVVCNRAGQIFLVLPTQCGIPIEYLDFGEFGGEYEHLGEEMWEQTAETEQDDPTTKKYSESIRMTERMGILKRDKDTELRNQRKEEELEVVNEEYEKQVYKAQFDNNVPWMCYIIAREPKNEIEAIDVDTEGLKIITGGKDASIRLYDLVTAKVIHEYYGYKKNCYVAHSAPYNAATEGHEGHYNRVHAVRFCDISDHVFFSGGLDGVVKAWDVRMKSTVKNLIGPVICGDALDSLREHLLCGQWARGECAIVYDVRNFKGTPINPTNRNNPCLGEFPYACRFLRGWNQYERTRDVHGDLFLSGSSGTLEAISISQNQVIRAYPHNGTVISVDSNLHLIVSSSSQHQLLFNSFFPNEEAVAVIAGLYDDEPSEQPPATAQDVDHKMWLPWMLEPSSTSMDTLDRLQTQMIPDKDKLELLRERTRKIVKKALMLESGIQWRSQDHKVQTPPLPDEKVDSSTKIERIRLKNIAEKPTRKLIKKLKEKNQCEKIKNSLKEVLNHIEGRWMQSEKELQPEYSAQYFCE